MIREGLLLSVFITFAVLGVTHCDDVVTPSLPVNPTKPNSTTTTTTSTTTPATTTSTSTPPPTTTTPIPPPKTTTPTPPITTPAPTPPVNYNGQWNVTGANNTEACVVAFMGISLDVKYSKKTANDTQNTTTVLHVPASANASGHCGNSSQVLILSWNLTGTDMVKMTFNFKKNGSSFTLDSVLTEIPASKVIFPGITVNETLHLSTFNHSLPIPIDQSYLCKSGIHFNMTNSAYTMYSELNLTNVHFQAFAKAHNNQFGTAIDCDVVPYVTPDSTPIIVGIGLSVLVAGVLVTYVLARKRSAGGYLSM